MSDNLLKIATKAVDEYFNERNAGFSVRPEMLVDGDKIKIAGVHWEVTKGDDSFSFKTSIDGKDLMFTYTRKW